MSSLSANIKMLMELAKITPSELSRRTQVAQAVIHRLSTGENTNPKLVTLKAVAEYFMVTVSQLIGEKSLPADRSFYKTHQKRRYIWSRIPLIDWKDTMSWPDSLPEYESSESTTYLSTDINVSKKAYALILENCAMEPLFPKGTVIIAEPERQPTNPGFAIVHLSGGQVAYLKQVTFDSFGIYTQSLNPDLAQLRKTKLQKEDRILATVIQAKLNR